MVKKKGKLKLTKSQKDAIKSISKFIDNKDIVGDQWFTLDGKAGVGKTTVLIEIIKKYCDSHTVIVGAIAHKAKNVLREKYSVARKENSRAVGFFSVASMLGMKFNEQTGEFEYSTYSETLLRPIDSATLIIIDECSMIDNEALQFILENKKSRAKLIFSGDLGQLPPVSDSVKPSKTFDTQYTYKLTERLRQGEKSPILPYSDLYWNSVMEQKDYLYGVQKNSIIDENGALYFDYRDNIFNLCIGTFKKALERHDMNLIKYICYRNVTREIVNRQIRAHLFGEAVKEYEEGDFMIMMDNYEISDTIIENSTEFVLTHADKQSEEIDGEEIFYYEIEGIGLDHYIRVVARESLYKYNALVTARFNKAKKEKEGLKKKSLFSDAYALKKKFASVDFAYAITSHKSQGSTYSCAIVDEPDIMNVSMTDITTKYRSMYTAITRASKMCVIVR